MITHFRTLIFNAIIFLVANIANAQVNNAECLSTTIPLEMATGETRTVSVTLKNSGAKAWTSGTYWLTPYPLPQSSSAMPAASQPIVENVSANNTVTLTFKITAPIAAGEYDSGFRMVEQNVDWFGATCGPKKIKVSSQQNNAECVSHTIPTTMKIGETRQVSVTMKNLGSKSWQNRHWLTAFPLPQSATSIPAPSQPVVGTIPTSDLATFQFSITAPSTPGSYDSGFRMVEQNVDWFGAVCGPKKIDIILPPNGAECVSNTIPISMNAGETRNVSITVKNTGSQTWRDSYWLTAYPLPQPANAISAASQPVLTSIPTGGTTTFNFNFTAPSTPGTYESGFRMVQQNVDWFGGICGPAKIIVWPAPSATNLLWDHTDAPPASLQWQSFPFDIQITGMTITTDWKKGAAADYCLAAFRDLVPTYPALSGGYSELFCINILQFGADQTWQRKIDLSATPLYIPAYTKIYCGSSGGSSPSTMGRRSCALDYSRYLEGQPRYRMLRIPYLDVGLSQNAPFFSSTYTGSATHALNIKGFFTFDGAVGGLTPCLQRQNRATGAITEERCGATVAKSYATNSEPAHFTPVSWSILASELLTAKCSVPSQPDFWDCAMFVVTEIPSSIKKNPENIFRDYGNVPADSLTSWCTNYIDNFIWPSQALQLCNYQPNCTRETKINNCRSAYAPATCMTSNSCQ